MEINILILSVGTRNKIVQYLKKALTDQEGNRLGSVIATDMSNIAPAIYEADKYYQVPRMMASDYMEVIFDICRKEKITAILSLIDPELSLLAKHEKEFAALSVKVIGSSYELCEMSLDKIQMYEWLTTHGYKTAKSYTDKSVFFKDIELGKISYPVFVKPVRGSASLAISKVNDKETIELLFAHADNLMIQEFLDGQEIGADVYIDMLSGEVVSIFTKRKIVMRAGETDKAVSFKDEKLFFTYTTSHILSILSNQNFIIFHHINILRIISNIHQISLSGQIINNQIHMITTTFISMRIPSSKTRIHF